MKLVRYPYSSGLLSDFDSLVADSFRAFSPLLRSTLTSAVQPAATGVEWYETEESFVARVEIPGVKKDDLKIELDDGLLRLAYRRRAGGSESDHVEQQEQVLRIPEGIDSEGISAGLEDGILELTLAKAEESKPRRIEIQ